MRGWWLGAMLAAAAVGWGQTEYTIDEVGSSECTGVLTDTGGAGDDYGGDEFFVFVVDLAPGTEIAVSFLGEVCLESPFDQLQIIDGPANSGLNLATVTGVDFVPEPVTAQSGMVTFIFQSDQSVNYCGFNLLWEANVDPPEPPVLAAQPVACGDAGVTWDIVPPVPCAAWVADSLTFAGGVGLGAPEVLCDGDSATGFFVPFAGGELGANCSWEVSWGLGLVDACDSVHVFTVEGAAAALACPVAGAWLDPVEAVCEGACDTLWWAPTGCFDVSWVWTQTGGGTVVDTPDSAGIVVCGAADVFLVATEATSGAVTSFSWSVGEEVVSLESALPESLCAGGAAVPLEAVPAGGTWAGTVEWVDGAWFLDAEAAAEEGGAAEMTYTTELGCSLDTAVQVAVVDAGGPYATCLGAPAFEAEGTAVGVDAVWSGPNISPTGTVFPNIAGTFDLVLSGQGCSDTATLEVITALPAFPLGDHCANGDPVLLPDVAEAGIWTGPGLNATATAFDPSNVPPGDATWECVLTGCTQPAAATILPIGAAPDTTACPAGTAVQLSGATPLGGTWSGAGISPDGLFDPSSAGSVAVTYTAPNGCTATTAITNAFPTAALDSLAICTAASPTALEATPPCGEWTASWGGAGLTGGCAAALDPAQVPIGEHVLTYTVGGCAVEIPVGVWPGAIELPAVSACNTDAPFSLAPADLPPGGSWQGAGVDPVSGWFTPADASPSGSISYTAPGGCITSATVQVEPWQPVTPGGAPDTLCAGLTFAPDWSPATGTTWTWEGLPTAGVAADTLAPGTYAVAASWQGTSCASDTAFTVTVPEPLALTLALTDPVICGGDTAGITYSAAGGLADDHSWDLTAALPWVPDSSQWWVAEISDGCSVPASDSVFVGVLVPEALQLSTPDTACFDGMAAVEAWILPAAPWELTWDSTAVAPDDMSADTTWWVLEASAGTTVAWALEWPAEGCAGTGMYTVPAYPEVTAEVAWPEECVEWSALPVGLVNAGGGATSVEWWFREPGTGEVLAQTQGPTATWQPDAPGDVLVQLTASIGGDCAVSTSGTVCVLAPMQWFLADQFSPNGDGLNEFLGVRAHPMSAFRMRVINRWGELVADLNAPQPGWDGTHRGTPAPTGVYVVQLDMTFTDGTAVTTQRHVTLVR